MQRPLEPDELLKLCHLAGEANVLELGSHPTAPGRCARLQFTRFVKGRFHLAARGHLRHAIVWLRRDDRDPDGNAILGTWSDWNCYVPGEAVFTHLTWYRERERQIGVYQTTWYNAVSRIERR
jgi:hypothetical protein